MNTFPIEIKALRVQQPLGVYYVAVIPARVLLEVAFSDVLSARLRETEGDYELDGTQRLTDPKRLQKIADYIDRTDSAFPNSIILAANSFQDEELTSVNDEVESDLDLQRWTVDEADNGCCMLRIPTKQKLAAIIDGQHRLFAFVNARPYRLEMNLICSVFIDLPKPYQAQLFATINSTQKPVSKSQTYELFGYNLEDEEEPYWGPDKLAVYLTRRLGVDESSPLKGRIVIAPKKDSALLRMTAEKSWRVSTAVVVEGIMRLITTNAKKDTTNLLDGKRRKRTDLASIRIDKSPLRGVYLGSQDAVIYAMTLNFVSACNEVFWKKASSDSFIIKTVGIQALFDILWRLAKNAHDHRNISAKYFIKLLAPAGELDFSTDAFRNASGSGRSAIRKAIEAEIMLENN